MFIDYVPFMLINLVAGLFLLALYVYRGLDDPDQKRWAPGFAMSGLVALVTGLRMISTWPLPGSFNISIGEMSALFGVVFLGAALVQALGWDQFTVTIYAFFAGLAAIVIGVRFMVLEMDREPPLAGIAYILAGLGGLGAAPAWRLRTNRTVRTIGAVIILAATLIWAITGYGAYWEHLSSFSEWVPPLMQK